MSNSVTKRIQNAMKQITLDYQARGFNVVTAFGNDEFDHLKDWMRSELHINLDTCAADSYVPRAENVIRFMRKDLGLYNVKHHFKNIHKD